MNISPVSISNLSPAFGARKVTKRLAKPIEQTSDYGGGMPVRVVVYEKTIYIPDRIKPEEDTGDKYFSNQGTDYHFPAN